jgi:hypothetical protein
MHSWSTVSATVHGFPGNGQGNAGAWHVPAVGSILANSL